MVHKANKGFSKKSCDYLSRKCFYLFLKKYVKLEIELNFKII